MGFLEVKWKVIIIILLVSSMAIFLSVKPVSSRKQETSQKISTMVIGPPPEAVKEIKKMFP